MFLFFILEWFSVFQKHGFGLITFVTENAQRNTVGPLRVRSLAPIWCLDCIIFIDDTLLCDACRWQDVPHPECLYVCMKEILPWSCMYKSSWGWTLGCSKHVEDTIMYKVHTPANVLFIKLEKSFKIYIKITLTCSYMFRPTTIIREPSLEPS